jgi:hypothetical protein
LRKPGGARDAARDAAAAAAAAATPVMLCDFGICARVPAAGAAPLRLFCGR